MDPQNPTPNDTMQGTAQAPLPNQPAPQAGNAFVTTDIPDPEELRKERAAKRAFYTIVIFIAVLFGLIVWEIVDLCL